jgi:hypothetical protein
MVAETGDVCGYSKEQQTSCQLNLCLRRKSVKKTRSGRAKAIYCDAIKVRVRSMED